MATFQGKKLGSDAPQYIDLTVNEHTFKVRRVEAGATYTVAAREFTNSSGERFNPYTHKPQNFSILEFSSAWPNQLELEGTAYFSWD